MLSKWQRVPWSHAGLRVRARVCACALAGPGFVCFPPNWLVFPCPAHQTACFSSHLASPPGLEPPACTRPARGRERRRGRRPTALASPDQAAQGRAGQGRTLPAPALPRPYPHSSRAMACPNLILWHPLIHPNFWTPKCSPLPTPIPTSHRLLFPSQPTGLRISNAEPGGRELPSCPNTNVKKKQHKTG